MKVGIVGAGAVGSACLLSLIMRGVGCELILVNRNRKRAEGVVTDMQYGAVLSPAVQLRWGDFSDLADASLVMITAGVNEKAGGATDRKNPAGRLRLLQANTDIYRQIVPEIHRAAPNALILVVSDPPDPLADVVRMLGVKRVLSTGTFLDTLRFRVHLARRLNVHPASVEALVLGEHGTSSVFLWSSARVAGRPVLEMLPGNAREEIEREVRYANITIIEGIGASQYGIGMACARIAEMLVRDERSVIPIGSYVEKFGVTLSLPGIIGREGLLGTLEPAMTDNEKKGLERSAEAIRQALSQLERGPARKSA